MPDAYTVDQLKTWDRCRKKYGYKYRDPLNWPSNPKNFRLGTGVHRLLDYEARGLPLEVLLSGVDADILTAWRLLRETRWAQLPVLASEWGFSLGVDDAWLYGRIDRIAQDGDTCYVLDWKTGTGIPRSPQGDWQTRVYLAAVYEAQRDLGLTIFPEQMAFVYVAVRHGRVETVDIPYAEAMHRETQVRLKETLSAIRKTQELSLPPACPDRHCPYRPICGILDSVPEAGVSCAV